MTATIFCIFVLNVFFLARALFISEHVECITRYTGVCIFGLSHVGIVTWEYIETTFSGEFFGHFV